MTALLDKMVAAAIEAGAATLRFYAGDVAIGFKADRSPVTAADHAAEAIILEHLARAEPTTPVIAEEEVAAGRIPRIGHRFFLVDPLDGTKEFIHGRGDFTVNIALIEAAEPVLGVVYAPAKGWLFGGEVRTGHAWRCAVDGKSGALSARAPIHVRAPPAEGLTAVASLSHRTPETDAFLARYPIARSVSIGSSLKFCLVAAGEADLYPRLGPTMEWDTAAGHAVLLAAGGNVRTLDGRPLQYAKPQFRNDEFIATGGTG